MNRADYREQIDAACRLLEARLAEDVPLEEVAAAAYLSRFHFHRLFRGLTGETVGAYVRRLRLERAAHRLSQTDDDILVIAFDVGYGSHEAFSRAFQRQFGTNPSVFRKEKIAMTTTSTTITNEPIDIRIETRPACTVAAVRHVGPYHEVGDAWGTLMKWGWTKMIFGKPEMFGLSHDDPDITPPERLRYDACIVVKPGTKVKGEIQLMELPAGTFAVTTHHGAYEGLAETYARLFGYIAENKIGGRQYHLGDPPAREVYMNDPCKTKQEDLLTEIWMPVIAG